MPIFYQGRVSTRKTTPSEDRDPRDGTTAIRPPKLTLTQPGPGRIVGRYVPLLVALAILVALVETAPPVKSPGSLTQQKSALALPAGITPPAPPGTPGRTVAGYRCGPGIRQVPWSKYAPICEPAWHGNNGGATAPGVTATTITLTYREAESAEEKALLSFVGQSTVGTNREAIETMEAYIRLFNRTFELYGRHVVLKPFKGKGDFLEEDEGKDIAAAQADAATAKKLGAFADISLLASTEPYDEALAHEGVIAIGAPFMSQSFFERYAPYEYTTSPTCNDVAEASATLIGHMMAGMKAIYAGSARLRAKTRVFGLLYPDNPQYVACGRQFLEELNQLAKVRPARVIAYSFDIADLEQEATNAISQFKAAGVTTVLCACDPVTPIFLTAAANQQHYYPEWFTTDWGDGFARLPAQNQWAHAMTGGIANRPLRDQEAYKAFFMGAPKGAQPIPTFSSVYEPLLLFFDALQAAGPYLTPETFEKGMDSLPPSLPGGMFGSWIFGNNKFSPSADTQILWWNPKAIVRHNHSVNKGQWQACNNGAFYGIAKGDAPLPKHRQLQCFGTK
jgi:hypothetical protein